MNKYHSRLGKGLIMLFALISTFSLRAQEPATNEFTIDAKMLTRGELRVGGFDPDNEDKERIAHFIMGQYRFNIGYKRSSWFELNLSPQMSCVWGQPAVNLGLAEAWVSFRSKQGLFASVGRQVLEYDNERILGYDDWTMTAPTHDVLKFGYEGHGHKVHALLAYNQDVTNVDVGGTYYSGGIQPYKSMQTLWYHYDTPKNIFGFSVIGMNIGMQNVNIKNTGNTDKEQPQTYYQQLFGTYMKLQPSIISLEGEFYYQMGKEEHGIPIDAFMGAAKFTATVKDHYDIFAGYDYLSGDKQFFVPAEGTFGVMHHEVLRGFCPLFGSHHEFYGAMDFFYVDSYYSSFTPGLQNLYVGCSLNPYNTLNIKAAYHFFAIATDVMYKKKKLKKPLGHDIELELSYTFADFIKIGGGYTFMYGTETMEILQRVTQKRTLHWGWIMLSVTPTIFTAKFEDKKKAKK